MTQGKIPRHVAIIPDGNRRWAKDKGLVETAGHVKAGAYENMSALFNMAKDLGVKFVSFWGFSTENWKRDKKESIIIFHVISKSFQKLRAEIHEKKFRFIHIGRKDRLPKKLVKEFEELEEESENYSELSILLCLDYGGRDEIVRAVKKIIESGDKDIDEEKFSSYLDTAGLPEPELIIRTGGENRLSGFMPYQSTYAELVFIEKYFPDFKPEDLKKAVENYSKVQKRFGN